MKYFLDTEFIEDGPHKAIDLISIGMVADDGREYYAISSEFNAADANEWVQANVINKLESDAQIPGKSLAQIAEDIRQFVGQDKDPQFWAYYADYDWVVFCQLFGAMIDLPEGWPMFCLDIKQYCVSIGNPELPKQEKDEHNALADARWNRMAWEFLEHSARHSLLLET
jgi:hypothetical protein